MTYDYNKFFSDINTEQLIEQKYVKDEDIDGKNYVDGSQGELKVLSLVSENDVDKIGGKIKLDRKVFTFYYTDEDNPTQATTVERKNVRQEVD